VPPIAVLVSVVVVPKHVVVSPAIADNGLTVIFLVAIHPVAVRRYDIVTAPLATPATTPVADPIVAIAVLPLCHVPPVVALASAID
jgi:hypothetical protein